MIETIRLTTDDGSGSGRGREAEGVHSWAPPGKLAARAKRWRCRRVTHNTSSPTTSLPIRLNLNLFQSVRLSSGGMGGKAGVGGGWVVAAAIDLWSASFCQFQLGQPCPRQPAPVSGSQPGHSRNPQPGGVWKAQQRRQLPLPRGEDGRGGGLNQV